MESEVLKPIRHAKGSIRELLSLVLPIFAILFTSCGVGFFERICLSRYSLETLEGSIQAIYVLQIFQFPLINFANMTQAFIGKHLGAREGKEVGPCVWQMGWIFLLSMLFIVPLGMLASSLFFRGATGEASATIYFYLLLGINFLYPLGAALSSFYLVQGETNFIMRSTLIAYGLNLILDFILIFGIPHVLPSLGVLGAALSIVISRLVFCGILFIYFLKQPNREQYRTNQWKIDFSKIRHYIRVCSPRAIGRGLTLLAWALTSHFMAIQGGDYLLVLSIGGTVVLFCYFFADSLIQALTLIFSRYIGAQEYQKIWKSWRAGLLLVGVVNGGLSIPFLFFPDFTLSFFFAELPIGPLREYLRLSLCWIWGWVLCNSLAGLFLPFLLAIEDTYFYMTVMLLTLITSTLPVYFFINHLNWAPDKFWLILMVEHFIILCFYSLRVHWIQRSQTSLNRI
jgi:MATE family multidrug resistance protein